MGRVAQRANMEEGKKMKEEGLLTRDHQTEKFSIDTRYRKKETMKRSRRKVQLKW